MAPLLHRAAIKTRMQVALHGTARCLQTDLVRISVRFFRRERSSLHRSEIKPSLPCDSSMFENVHDSLQLITEWAGLSVNLRPVFVSSPMNARASIAIWDRGKRPHAWTVGHHHDCPQLWSALYENLVWYYHVCFCHCRCSLCMI